MWGLYFRVGDDSVFRVGECYHALSTLQALFHAGEDLYRVVEQGVSLAFGR